jgi:hypothetical protein
MVLGTGPANVETVIVGGDIVKRDGKLTGDHVGHALELMHATRERLTPRAMRLPPLPAGNR